ncbi:MAG TPA: hypothetical protein VGF03_03715 [Bryobacteraceae bacterium]|jgi:hypothetical protein
MNGATEKYHAHELIERLPESQVSTAIRFLEFMLLDPIARAVATAPPDDEPVTEQDRERLQAGQAWFAHRRGKGIPMEEVLAEFELKPEDFLRLPEDTR